MKPTPLEPPAGPQLARVLGPWMATAVVVGTVIGSGIFAKPHQVNRAIPEFALAMLAWVLGGVLALVGALAYAEVVSIHPRAGGNYVFLKEAYGRWAGFLWGWVEFWIIRASSLAALATLFTSSLHDILCQVHPGGPVKEVLSFWARQGMTVTVIAVLALVNARGTRWGGVLHLFLTTIKVSTLLGLAVLPFVVAGLSGTPRAVPEPANLEPIWPSSSINWTMFGAGLVGVLWAYHGWMNVAPVAEEVRDPQRNLPLALLVGTLTIIGLYLAVNVAYYLILTRGEIGSAKETTVAALFSEKLLGPVGGVVASAAVMVSVFGALNGNLLVGPRLLFAMGRDRLAPPALARIHPSFGTPALAILTLAAWAMLLVPAAAALTRYGVPVFQVAGLTLDLNVPEGKGVFDVVTDLAIFGSVTFETLAVVSLIVFRRRYPPSRVDLPYRCPLFPWLPLLYAAIMAGVLYTMFVEKRAETLFGVGFIAIGAVVYWRVFARGGRADLPADGEVRGKSDG